MFAALVVFAVSLLAAEPTTRPFAEPAVPPLRLPALSAADYYPTYRDVVYATAGEARRRDMKLDLYLPTKESDAPRPLLIWIHGGGWVAGNKALFVPMLFAVEHGYAVASISYRFSQEAVFPAQIDDCRAAVAFLREHADELGLDPERFAVAGESAGGHLAALLGTSGDGSAARVQAVVDLFGPTDMLLPNTVGDRRTVEVYNDLGTKLLGGTPTERPDVAKQASPVAFVDANDPPFLIIHGRRDLLVPLEHSENLKALLDGAGVKAELVVLPNAGHGGPDFASAETRTAILEFVNAALAVGSPAD